MAGKCVCVLLIFLQKKKKSAIAHARFSLKSDSSGYDWRK